jgi:hypothetical protein
MKPTLIGACNEILGQSAANKMKHNLFWNDKVERGISGMAEDMEMQLIKEIKSRCLLYNWGNHKCSEQQHFTYVCTEC